MKLSISRDLNNLIPEQQTVDQNIANANKQLKEYAESLDREELLMWLTNIIIRIFKGDGNIMDQTILAFLKTVMDNTEIDEQIYKMTADQLKDTIPGDEYEPLIGKILAGLGAELQK